MKESKTKDEIEKEAKELIQMLQSSKQVYEKEIRSMENRISWYRKQREIIINSIEAVNTNSTLMIAKVK